MNAFGERGVGYPLDRQQSSKRPCLRCGSKFLSLGPYNRICKRCHHKNAKLASQSAARQQQHLLSEE